MRRPWTDRGAELFPTEDARAQYAAWQEWFRAEEATFGFDWTPIIDVIDDHGSPSGDIILYLMFSAAFDSVPAPNATVEQLREHVRILHDATIVARQSLHAQRKYISDDLQAMGHNSDAYVALEVAVNEINNALQSKHA